VCLYINSYDALTLHFVNSDLPKSCIQHSVISVGCFWFCNIDNFNISVCSLVACMFGNTGG